MRKSLTLASLALCLVTTPAMFAQSLGDESNNPRETPTTETPAPAPAKDEKPQGLAGARFLRVSPDGKQLAFSLWSDIWVMPVEGGRATRLTLHESNDIKPVWSRDGKRIAFTSDRNGSFDVFTMPADGGVPTRLTFDSAQDHVCEYSADGSSIIIQSTMFGGEWRLYSLPVDGGQPVPVTPVSSAGGSFSSDGWVYFVMPQSDAKIKGYRGSANDELYRMKLEAGSIPEQLTKNNQNDREPYISADNKTLYFIREAGKSHKDFNLFAMNVETREEKQITTLDQNGLNNLTFNSDFTKVWFTWKYRIFSLDLTTAGATPVACPVEIIEDSRRETVNERVATSGAQSLDISASGKTLALEIGGSIWLVDSAGGAARQLTKDGSGDRNPRFSADGRWVSFYSTARSGSEDIFVVSTDGTQIKQLTFSPEAEHFQNWAPDGTWLVFSADRKKSRQIWRMNADGSNPQQLTNTPFNNDDPAVSPDGKLIAYDSHASGRADIWVMNADGSNPRRVYGTLAQEESPRFSPDGRLLVFNRSNRSGTGTARSVVVTDLAGSGEIVIAEGRDGVFSPDGKEIFYLDPQGRIKAVPAPQDVSGGRTINFTATRRVEQSVEFQRTFDEAIKLITNNFYDPKYHGNDMKALRAKYDPLIRAARTRMEFYYYMNELVGELTASHQAVSGPVNDVPTEPTGLLACEVFPEAIEAKAEESAEPKAGDEARKKEPAMMRLRVTRVDKDGPADKSWIRTGDYIFGVGKDRLTMGDSFAQKLNGSAGKPVTLMVGTKPDGSDIRMVTVTPEDGRAASARNYQQMVNKCRTTVKEASSGSVAYIHIPQMNPQALQQFQNELGSKETQACKALVLDVRGNGGGNIHQELIDILSRRYYANNTTQKGEGTKSPSLYWERPIVLLINKRSYSDAEVFPHAFKALGMGTIVGEPTPGAVIGTNNVNLADGTMIRVTSFGFFNLDGTNQEGNGCQPDVLVEMTVEDRMAERDPQLQKAIEIALEKIASSAAAKGQPGPNTPAKPDAGSSPDGKPASAPSGEKPEGDKPSDDSKPRKPRRSFDDSSSEPAREPNADEPQREWGWKGDEDSTEQAGLSPVEELPGVLS